MESISTYFEIYRNIFVLDFLRYFIPASVAFLLFWVIFRKTLGHRFIQQRWPSNKRLWSEFKYSLSTVAIFAIIGVGIYLAKQNGYTQFYDEPSQFGSAYLVISFIIMVLFHDMYFYWTHRWMHHPEIYRHVHKVHHLSTNPSPWAAYSFHPLEAVVQALVFPILIFTIPVYTGTAFIFLLYMILRNVMGHLGLELFPKKFMKQAWINWHTTTTHHNMHHEHFNYNYGLYFTWWDKWFGTEHKSYKERFEDVTHRKPDKTKVIVTLLLFSITGLSAQTPEGQWMTFDESSGAPLSIISVYKNKQADLWEGRIDSVILLPNQGENPICTECTGKLKDQPVIGMRFMWGYEKSGTEWIDGYITDPVDGTIYTSKIWFENENQLSVRAYGGPLGFFHRTQTWHSVDGQGIEGLWKTIDDTFNMPKSLVRLRIVEGKLTGTIEKLFLLPHEGNFPICIECHDDLKNQPVVGLRIMKGFKENDGEWNDGSILDPGNGMTYSAKFWLKNENTLIIRGYLGPFFRTQEWKRKD